MLQTIFAILSAKLVISLVTIVTAVIVTLVILKRISPIKVKYRIIEKKELPSGEDTDMQNSTSAKSA